MPIELALALLLFAALGWRLAGGYPAPPAKLARLSRREAAFVAAAAEALFPPGGALPRSGLEAGVPAWTDRWLDALPPGTRRLVRLLFALVEHATLIFPAPGLLGWRRFSALDAERRGAVLEGWRTSRLFARRLVFTSLRAILTQGYFADAAVLRALSLAPRAIEAEVHEADTLYPPIGRDKRALRFRPEQVEVRGPLDRPPAGEPLGPHGPLHPAYREVAPSSQAERRARAEPSGVVAGSPPQAGAQRGGAERSRPSGFVRVFAEYERDLREEADVVVVGSGPCGAVVAKELAEAGRSIVLLEEGPPFTPEDFALDGALSMARTMREAGLRATRGHVMPTMQAIALGGGSLVNSAICVRPPAFVFDAWASGFELAHTSRADLDPHFDAVEGFLGIAPTPDAVQGRRNLLFREGCEKLGIASEPIARNVRGCRGSGECFTGCRARAKQSMDLSYVPAAIRAGARVYTSVRAERVAHSGRVASGVEARVVAPFTGRPGPALHVAAKAVVLSAGCMATPLLLLASDGLANRSGQVGQNLQFHPGVAVMGVFPERVDPQFGATQGMQSLHFLREGFKLETLWAPPAVLAVRLPGAGLALKERLAELPYASIVDAIASCHHSLGQLRPRRSGSLDPVLHWRLHPDDLPVLGRALGVLVEVLFAAGARKVLPGVHGLPDELVPADLAALRRRSFRPSDFVMAANHAFCTTRMHGDPTQGVVDEWGRCHDLDNLYLADTGVFPRCTSVNPMLTGMALAHRTAKVLASRL